MSCGLFYFFGRLPILFLYQRILFSFQRSTLFLQSNMLFLLEPRLLLTFLMRNGRILHL